MCSYGNVIYEGQVDQEGLADTSAADRERPQRRRPCAVGHSPRLRVALTVALGNVALFEAEGYTDQPAAAAADDFAKTAVVVAVVGIAVMSVARRTEDSSQVGMRCDGFAAKGRDFPQRSPNRLPLVAAAAAKETAAEIDWWATESHQCCCWNLTRWR
jgi:hypothetical protein